MLRLTDKGLFCEAGDFFIDPKGKVDLALITHAHSDHARSGSKEYYCLEPSLLLLERRLRANSLIRTLPNREKRRFGSVWVSFHPAGHILGSAQIRIEKGSNVWVVSSDYKREPDPSCDPFEVVSCDTFITEATFGYPSYRWPEPNEVMGEIHNWWQENRKAGKNSVLFCYAAGKTQRVLAHLREWTDRPVYLFGEAVELTEVYRQQGISMVETVALEEFKGELKGELIIAPQSILKSKWADKLEPFESAFASGWNATGAFGIRRSYDRGFVLSDHADWPALLKTAQETNAKRVYVHTIGSSGGGTRLAKELCKLGLQADVFTERSHLDHLRWERWAVQGDLFTS